MSDNDVKSVGHELLEEVRTLQSDVRRSDERRKRSMVLMALCLIAFLGLSVMMYITLHSIQDATSPGGKVYERSQRGAGLFILDIKCDSHRLHGEKDPIYIDGQKCPTQKK